MNILVIGNGFDLAHGLPTNYTDFLQFCNLIKQIQENKWYQDIDKLNEIFLKKDFGINSYLRGKVVENYLKGKEKELAELVCGNEWIDYFLQCDMHGNENWIDFEREISKAVQDIDRSMGTNTLYDEIIFLENKYFNDKCTNNTMDYIIAMYEGEGQKIRKPKIQFKELVDSLSNDLLRLIRALEIYFSEYVSQIECNKISPDIKGAFFDKVISFNYTDTYEKVYTTSMFVDFDYIHGKADKLNTIRSNNMVLGIDEYLSDDRRDKDIEFIVFKKYYQRIYKETGCKYKEWVDEIHSGRPINNLKFGYVGEDGSKVLTSERALQHNLYIFGHSLDVTDGDVLRELILSNNVHTTIYYLNKNIMGQQIANLVKIIGQDELIKRTGGSTKTIAFKQQQNMLETGNGS